MDKTINTNIATEFHSIVRLNVYCWNIANAVRDEKLMPLSKRLDDICNVLENEKESIDVLIVLEAGRPSSHLSWTTMASTIELRTGLRYVGIRRANASEMSFGKAVFERTSSVYVTSIEQRWLSDTPNIPSGPHFGYDTMIIRCRPVIDNKVIVNDNATFSIAAVLFPLQREARISACDFLKKIVKNDGIDIVVGDMNTFADDGGPEMLSILENDAGFVSCLPSDTKTTFNAFPHDTITIENEKLSFFPPHCVVSKGESTSIVRPSGWLDRAYFTATERQYLKCAGRVIKLGDDCSDHYPLSIQIEDLI